MIKKKILIKGRKVHNVGYRLFLMNLADDLGIENFDAKNVHEDEKQCVKVLVKSSESKVNKFFNILREDFPEHTKVESIDIEGYGEWVKSLESFRSGFNSHQLSKIANAGVGMDKTLSKLNQNFGGMNETLNELNQNTGKKTDIDNLTGVVENCFGDLGKKYHSISGSMNFQTIVLSVILLVLIIGLFI